MVSILGPNGKPIAPRPSVPAMRRVRAKYDAAETNAENQKLWMLADGLSARSANSPEIRAKLRNRARYEAANNSYCGGLALTLANDLIGTGPRLQFRSEDVQLNRRIEGEFEEWSAATGLAERLRTMRRAKVVDGESFVRIVNNPTLPTRVQIDLREIEADQVATPDLWLTDPSRVDGIEFDRYGNPRWYHLLRDHPGDTMRWSLGTEYDRLPASVMLHWFRVDRPGQARGVPEITPALHLFALLRRYTLAVLAAAETAADFSAVIYSELPPDGETAAIDPMDELQIARRMMLTLPAGWKMGQFRAEQPTSTYAEFKHELLNEIARCLNVPFNVAAGNSSGYNYASGRLDHQTYFRALSVEQYHLETAILSRIFRAWLGAAYMADLLPEPPDRLGGWPHAWFWDGVPHVDPLKEAKATTERLASHTTTLALEWARQGYDWREAMEQRAEEIRLLTELGIPMEVSPSTVSETENDDESE